MATLTIVAALLPMMFVIGLMGPYMSPIPANASMAMLFSFFVAVIGDAVAAAALRARKRFGDRSAAAHGDHDVGAMGRFYIRDRDGRCSRAAWRSKVFLITVGVATLAACALFCTKDVRVKLLPFDNKSELQVVLDLPHGATARGHGPHADDGGRAARGPAGAGLDPGLCRARPRRSTSTASCATIICATSREMGDLSINLTPKGERSRASHAIALDIRQRLAGPAAARRTRRSRSSRCRRGRRCCRRCWPRSMAPTPRRGARSAASVRKAFESVDFVVDVDDSYGVPDRPAALLHRSGGARISRRRGAGGL